VFTDGWQLGTPDLVVTMPEAYALPAKGGDVFRNFVFAVPAAPTRYVRAIEFRADNPKVIHHANVAVDPGRVARRSGPRIRSHARRSGSERLRMVAGPRPDVRTRRHGVDAR
jgi:hypothetical protein